MLIKKRKNIKNGVTLLEYRQKLFSELPRDDSKLVIGYALKEGTPVCVGIPKKAIVQHTHVIGAQGSGKTSLLVLWAYESLRKGFNVIVVDPHKHLVKNLYERTPADIETHIVGFGYEGIQIFPFVNIELIKKQKARVEHLPPSVERAQAIENLIEGFRAHTSARRGSSKGVWGANVNLIAYYAFWTLALATKPEHKRLELVLELLDEYSPVRDDILNTAKRHPELAPDVEEAEFFWNNEYKRILSKQDAQTTVLGFINKIKPLVRTAEQRRILNGSLKLTDFFLTDKQKLLLIHFEEGAEWTRLVGALFFVNMYMSAFWRTPEWERLGYRPVHIIIDEVSAFTSSLTILEDALTKTRKFGVGLTLAHQTFSQFDPEIAQTFGSTLSSQAKQSFVMSLPSSQDIKYLEGRLAAGEKDRVGRLAPGHFVYLDREGVQFRGVSYYYENVLPLLRKFPEPSFNVPPLVTDQMGVYQFLPLYIRSYAPEMLDKEFVLYEIPFPELPEIAVHRDIEEQVKLLNLLFAHFYEPILAVLKIDKSAPLQRGAISWLNNYAVGKLVTKDGKEVPVVVADYKKTPRLVEIIYPAVVTTERHAQEVANHLRIFMSLQDDYKQNKYPSVLIYEYARAFDNKKYILRSVEEKRLMSPSWIAIHIYLRTPPNGEKDPYELSRIMLSKTPGIYENNIPAYIKEISKLDLSDVQLV